MSVEQSGSQAVKARPVFARGRLVGVSLWLLFAAVLLASFYPAAARLRAAGQNPLELIRADAGNTSLEAVFWIVYLAVILCTGLLLPGKWISTSRPVLLRIAIGAALMLLGVAGVMLSLRFGSEALRRALNGVFGASLVLLAGWGLGVLLLRVLRVAWAVTVERVLFELLMGLGLLAYLYFALALVGQYTPQVVRWLTAFLAGAGAAYLLRLGAHRYQTRAKRASQPTENQQLARADRFWLAVILAAGLVALAGALAPEVEFDALWYHLWLPVKWLQAGHPLDLVDVYVSLYPLHWELLYGAALNWGGPVAAKLVNFAALPLMAVLVFRLARRLLPGTSPWLAVALLVSTPTLLWEATTAYNDLALALYVTLAVYALSRYLEGRERGWLLLTAASLGQALAIKHLALFALLLLTGGLFAILLFRERNFWRAVVPPALLAVISLLFPLPWYARSFLASGNPFFPELYNLFGALPLTRWDARTAQGLASFTSAFGYPRTPANLLALPWNMTVHAERFGGQLGALFLLLIPGLLFRRRSWAVTALSGLAVGYLLLWASPFSSFQMRFVVPLVGVLALLGAAGYAALRERLGDIFGKTGQWVLQAGLVLMMLVNLPPFVVLQESGRNGWEGWLSHVTRSVPVRVVLGTESETDYLSRLVPSYQAWNYINTQLPAGVKVLTFVEGDNLYSQRERLWSNATLARQAIWDASPGQNLAAVRDALSRLGITHILINRALLEPNAAPPLPAFSELAANCLSQQYEDRHYLLLGITCTEAAP